MNGNTNSVKCGIYLDKVEILNLLSTLEKSPSPKGIIVRIKPHDDAESRKIINLDNIEVIAVHLGQTSDGNLL